MCVKWYEIDVTYYVIKLIKMIKKMRILWSLLWIGLISSFFFLTLEQWLICLILGYFWVV